MLTLEEVEVIASNFRNAFDKIDLSDAPGILSKFPNGCCNWTARLLGHFFQYDKNQFVKEIDARRNKNGCYQSHSWLLIHNTIIDITADQFKDCNEKVIVSENSTWHKEWEVLQEHPIIDIKLYDASITQRNKLKPSTLYKILLKEVC